jgi:tryptophan halogenase
VAFDLEPISPEDWTILHFGMRRRPQRYDRIADREPESEVSSRLTAMRQEIDKVAASLPTHQDYMAKLLGYLRQKKW